MTQKAFKYSLATKKECLFFSPDLIFSKSSNFISFGTPFGGFKGYAINLLIDVLSGSLVRGKSGLDVPLDSQRYNGTLIIVLDPATFGDLKEFKKSTTKLVDDILAVPPIDPSHPVRVPGVRGFDRLEKFTKEGFVEIQDEDWRHFSQALEKLESAQENS